MNAKKYEVLIDKMVVAERMELETATILVKAIFNEYHNQYPLTVSVKEMERCEGCSDDR